MTVTFGRILARIESGDSTLTELAISRGTIYSNDVDSWKILGKAVSKSTCLKKLTIGWPMAGTSKISSVFLKAFCSSAKDNKSIETLAFEKYDFEGGLVFHWLAPLFAKNTSLKMLVISYCTLTSDEITALCAPLSRCTSLEAIDMSDNNLSEEFLFELVACLKCLPLLESLKLGGNNIGPVGCTALSHLLCSQTKMKKLDLRNCNINDNGTILLCDALLHNTSLKTLVLQNNKNITKAGWYTFSRLVCDQSSISRTFHSNHTLEILIDNGCEKRYLPKELVTNLRANCRKNKQSVARHKVLAYHIYTDAGMNVAPFLNIPLSLMHHAYAVLSMPLEEEEGERIKNRRN